MLTLSVNHFCLPFPFIITSGCRASPQRWVAGWLFHPWATREARPAFSRLVPARPRCAADFDSLAILQRTRPVGHIHHEVGRSLIHVGRISDLARLVSLDALVAQLVAHGLYPLFDDANLAEKCTTVKSFFTPRRKNSASPLRAGPAVQSHQPGPQWCNPAHRSPAASSPPRRECAERHRAPRNNPRLRPPCS